MSVLLLRLAGPMQSWGIQSRFSHRDTEREPTKSGVLGLLCAALGRPRSESIGDLTGVRMGVRVDREGRLERDFQTALDVHKSGSNSLAESVISNRHYLADADFLVGLEGDASEFLVHLDRAMRQPHWPICLGRKSYVPGIPPALPPGQVPVREGSLEEVLQAGPWQCRRPQAGTSVRYAVEVPAGSGRGEPRMDSPHSFETREFRARYVEFGFWNLQEAAVTAP